MYQNGRQLMAQRHFKDALPIFQALLKQDSSNIDYLQYTAFLYAKVPHDAPKKIRKIMPGYYRMAHYLAKKAIAKDSNSAEAHYALAFVIGVENEDADTKQQIANAKAMKVEIDKCLALNPHHAGAWHLLGRWYRKLAEINGLERLAMSAIYGASLPEATYADAAKAFEKAYLYEPDYILHQYELALTYHRMGKDIDAKIWLERAIKANYTGDDEVDTKKMCQDLLGDIE
jgi:tetratricopeptide (TPR) repeat protein